MKACVRCKVPKEESEFWKNARKKDGLRSECKECTKVAARKYYAENREARISHDLEYYYHNKEARQVYNRAYQKLHRKHYRALIAKVARTLTGRFSSLRSSAKYRGILFDLTLEQYKDLIVQNCFYCGNALSNCGGGLDRIDSNGGYTVGNVRPCCGTRPGVSGMGCNNMKNSMSEAEFRERVRQIFMNWAGHEDLKEAGLL